MANMHTITVCALDLTRQPERSFGFASEADRTEFRTQAKAAGWSTVRMASFEAVTVEAAMAELAAATPEPEE